MAKMLNRIEQPSDLKGLTHAELRQLAAEIRERLVTTVTAQGGHLASNLGVVELTIALHRVFDSPRDKLIWDVGHQSYVHKLLTGRRQNFASLRQYGGLSGFTDRTESPHDPFGAGHASTSISAALGIAIARDLAGDDFHVIAVIGDGALTGGMAFEALNHAGHLAARLIVILNDNGMSISPTVGALATLLGKVRLDQRYRRAKKGAEEALSAFPLSDRFRQVSRRLTTSIKSLAMPTTIWEELGFTYIGPLDGHNIPELEVAFAQARSYSSKPVFIHVATTKGKGYYPAESDAIHFHGVPATNESIRVAPTYSEVFAQTVLRLMRDDPRVIAVTAAMPESNYLSLVTQEFPERVFDVGICEQHAVTFAAGMATQGFIPIVAIYSTFLQRALDQIIHDVCLQDLPIVFALDRSGIVGEDGKTHQGIFDLSYLTLVPNMIVAAPKDENELQHLLFTAVKANHPMAIRYPRGYGLGVELDQMLCQLPLGKGEIVRRGEDVTLLAIGSTLTASLTAAEEMAQKGIQAMVINARFAKPLDAELILKSACSTRQLVTIEENVLNGGFGSAVLQLLQNSGAPPLRVKCLGIRDEFVKQGSPSYLRSKLKLDTEGIVQQILALFPEFDDYAKLKLESETVV